MQFSLCVCTELKLSAVLIVPKTIQFDVFLKYLPHKLLTLNVYLLICSVYKMMNPVNGYCRIEAEQMPLIRIL